MSCMAAIMDIVGHIAELHGHQVNGVIQSPSEEMVTKLVKLTMTVNAHTKNVRDHVLCKSY